jgi:hypothetical protein
MNVPISISKPPTSRDGWPMGHRQSRIPKRDKHNALHLASWVELEMEPVMSQMAIKNMFHHAGSALNINGLFFFSFNSKQTHK